MKPGRCRSMRQPSSRGGYWCRKGRRELGGSKLSEIQVNFYLFVETVPILIFRISLPDVETFDLQGLPAQGCLGPNEQQVLSPKKSTSSLICGLRIVEMNKPAQMVKQKTEKNVCSCNFALATTTPLFALAFICSWNSEHNLIFPMILKTIILCPTPTQRSIQHLCCKFKNKK